MTMSRKEDAPFHPFLSLSLSYFPGGAREPPASFCRQKCRVLHLLSGGKLCLLPTVAGIRSRSVLLPPHPFLLRDIRFSRSRISLRHGRGTGEATETPRTGRSSLRSPCRADVCPLLRSPACPTVIRAESLARHAPTEPQGCHAPRHVLRGTASHRRHGKPGALSSVPRCSHAGKAKVFPQAATSLRTEDTPGVLPCPGPASRQTSRCCDDSV